MNLDEIQRTSAFFVSSVLEDIEIKPPPMGAPAHCTPGKKPYNPNRIPAFSFDKCQVNL